MYFYFWTRLASDTDLENHLHPRSVDPNLSNFQKKIEITAELNGLLNSLGDLRPRDVLLAKYIV